MANAYTTMPAATVPFLVRLGAFVVAPSPPPVAVRERLRVQMAHVLAAALSAPSCPTGRWARRASGPHPLLGAGVATARMEAILGSIARVGALDFGLFGRASVAAIVPIVLGAPGDLPWSSIEAAQLVGAEIGLRAGIATVLRSRSFAEPCAVAALGGAAAACRVLELDAETTTAALARACAHHGDDYGEAALAGVLAAELAYDGMRETARIPEDFASHAFDDLGRAWASGTIHPKEHAAPAHAQTAIDAAREASAQACSILKRSLRAEDVARIEVETTAFGAANAKALSEHVSRALGFETQIHVVHAWELTSELLWRALPAFDVSTIVRSASFLRALGELDVGAASVTHLASEAARLLSRRATNPESAPSGFAFPLATRITVTLTNGARLRAERATPRGGPDARIEEARTIAREKLRILGRGRLAELVLAPPRSLRVSDVLAAM
ncbi:MAG: hypothetical protein ACXVEF_27185 [Polyangiales bacterium]